MSACKELECCPPNDLTYQAAVELWQTADLDSGDANAQAVAQFLSDQGAQAILLAGDLDYNVPHDYDASVEAIYGEWKDRGMLFPTPGNHDWDDDNLAAYLAYFDEVKGSRYYAVRFGPLEVFFIDSDIREPDGNTVGSIQYDRIAEKIGESTAPWKCAMMHHPPYSSDAVHGSQPDSQWDFKELGIDFVLSGHGHDYEHILLEDVHYFVNGLGGAAIYNFSTPVVGSVLRYNANRGALRIRASFAELNIAFFNIFGVLIEMVKLKK